VLRLFSIFPSRGPGIALLLLRISVALTIVLDASSAEPSFVSPLMWAGLSLVALALCIGFATPLAAVLGCFIQLAVWFAIGHSNARLGVSVLNSLALALLGPGAYSLDARLFGRREIVLRHSAGPINR
jgi:uncharacterized membrane protein YphA (DoxX/SURF4 family)